jgi:hypothetical protein
VTLLGLGLAELVTSIATFCLEPSAELSLALFISEYTRQSIHPWSRLRGSLSTLHGFN